MHPTSRDRPDRRDSLGRRIGYNWWREWICEILLEAEITWLQQRETECCGWATEEREFAQLHPRPTLKDFLIRMAGFNKNREGEAA